MTEPISPEDARKARRAKRLLYACMAVFILAPAIAYFLMNGI